MSTRRKQGRRQLEPEFRFARFQCRKCGTWVNAYGAGLCFEWGVQQQLCVSCFVAERLRAAQPAERETPLLRLPALGPVQ